MALQSPLLRGDPKLELAVSNGFSVCSPAP